MGNCNCCGDNNFINEEDIEKQKEKNLQKDLKDIDSNILQKQNKKKIFGIINSGNTCFMNSSLQGIFHCDEYNNQMKLYLNENKILTTKLLVKEYLKILKLIEKGDKEIDVSKIKTILSKVEEKYKTNEQCDANEFISIFLNQMLNELKGIEPLSNNIFPNNINDTEIKKQFERLNKLFINKNNSFLIDLFYGKLIKELYCEKGHRISIKFQIYNIIELPIYKCSSYCFSGSNYVELIDLLKEYQKNHIVDEKIECNICGKEVLCYSKTTIFNIPKYLILFLNQDLKYSYNLQYVDFNETLETNDFLKYTDFNKIYNLVGVINYYGNRESGHYTANCKNLIDKKWYYISDSYIEQLNDFDDIKSKYALILFYEQQ